MGKPPAGRHSSRSDPLHECGQFVGKRVLRPETTGIEAPPASAALRFCICRRGKATCRFGHLRQSGGTTPSPSPLCGDPAGWLPSPFVLHQPTVFILSGIAAIACGPLAGSAAATIGTRASAGGGKSAGAAGSGSASIAGPHRLLHQSDRLGMEKAWPPPLASPSNGLRATPPPCSGGLALPPRRRRKRPTRHDRRRQRRPGQPGITLQDRCLVPRHRQKDCRSAKSLSLGQHQGDGRKDPRERLYCVMACTFCRDRRQFCLQRLPVLYRCPE